MVDKEQSHGIDLVFAAHIISQVPDPDKAAAKEKFLHFLEQKNLRITQQRRAIVDLSLIHI